jgi:hypothetical protein
MESPAPTPCPACKRAIHAVDPKICPFCGALIVLPVSPETRALNESEYDEDSPIRLGTSHFGQTMLCIELREPDKQFLIDPEKVNELVIGRRDPLSGDTPDVDLHEYNALDRGVSRRHATIVRRGTSLQIVDSGTPNGSYLNGQRLIPSQPRILRDGDELRLGKITLYISFVQVSDKTVTP